MTRTEYRACEIRRQAKAYLAYEPGAPTVDIMTANGYGVFGVPVDGAQRLYKVYWNDVEVPVAIVPGVCAYYDYAERISIRSESGWTMQIGTGSEFWHDLQEAIRGLGADPWGAML